MNRNNDPRSPLKRWLNRMLLTVDSGFVILALLATATVLLFGFRLVYQTDDVPETIPQALPADRSEIGISGEARIVDGDTLEVAGTKIRLFGIDAPEGGQICRDASNNDYDCGTKATEQLDRLIGGQVVSCTPRTTDRYGRTVAVCSIDGIDLGRELVYSGWAVAFERYSRDYVNDESSARGNRVGLWLGSFERPSEYRAGKRAAQ